MPSSGRDITKANADVDGGLQETPHARRLSCPTGWRSPIGQLGHSGRRLTRWYAPQRLPAASNRPRNCEIAAGGSTLEVAEQPRAADRSEIVTKTRSWSASGALGDERSGTRRRVDESLPAATPSVREVRQARVSSPRERPADMARSPCPVRRARPTARPRRTPAARAGPLTTVTRPSTAKREHRTVRKRKVTYPTPRTRMRTPTDTPAPSTYDRHRSDLTEAAAPAGSRDRDRVRSSFGLYNGETAVVESLPAGHPRLVRPRPAEPGRRDGDLERVAAEA